VSIKTPCAQIYRNRPTRERREKTSPTGRGFQLSAPRSLIYSVSLTLPKNKGYSDFSDYLLPTYASMIKNSNLDQRFQKPKRPSNQSFSFPDDSSSFRWKTVSLTPAVRRLAVGWGFGLVVGLRCAVGLVRTASGPDMRPLP
jgi:hypothetical protein